MIINRQRFKGLQAYKVKGREEYLYANWGDYWPGHYVDVFACLQEGDIIPNCHSSASVDYIREECREMSFAKLPEAVQQNLVNYSWDWNNG